MEKNSKASVPWEERQSSKFPQSRSPVAVGIFLFVFACLWRIWPFLNVMSELDIAQVKKCAIDNLHADLSFLGTAAPINASEFLHRRERLAQALAVSGVDAFILEPGYTFQYYGNISQSDWEPWEPEERPFLMIILPLISESGLISAKTAFLAPHFEEGRVRMLGIPSREPELDIVTWEEHWDPYATLLDSHLFPDLRAPAHSQKPKLMVDEEMRDFIARGLANAGFETSGLSPDVERVRQLKSPSEVEVLRAVNSGTVAAVRAMQPCLVAGLTENEVRDILDASLLSVGFSLFFNIVLFEEDGALPHGGFVVGGKRLTEETMVVIDVGAHYLGYSSDICRSFFIDPAARGKQWLLGPLTILFKMMGLHPTSTRDPDNNSKLHAEKLKVWNVVLEAQTAAEYELRANNSAANVDLAARNVISEAGYGYGFTHRVGHGIGIKAHESPYLNKWNTQVSLQPGMTFTNEPGIYLEGKFGVRHEDVYLIKEHGDAELLTGRRAESPYDP